MELNAVYLKESVAVTEASSPLSAFRSKLEEKEHSDRQSIQQ
jgi:hypothetical protein